MGGKRPIVAINTLAFHGYPLDTALGEIARLADYVEPVFITKYDPTLREEYFNEDNAWAFSRRLEQLKLKIVSMGSHMDLGQSDAAAIFRNRMEFAAKIGAKTIITNAGHKSCKTTFYKNMGKLISYAEKIDITIAFENPGDGQDLLLGDGIEAIEVLERLGSDRARFNYDFSNVFTYSKGKKYPGQELGRLLPYIGHLHLKNVKLWKGHWMVCSIGKGVINYRNLFQQFPALLNIPMSIELPIGYGYDDQFNFALRKESPELNENFTAPPIEYIRKVLSSSLRFYEINLRLSRR